MKWSTCIAAVLTMAGQSFGAAIESRQSTSTYTDADILNYALTLEHLEDKFYREGLMNFTASQFAAAGFDNFFYTNLQEISFDETTHVSFLTGALNAAGAPAVQECTYNFGIDKNMKGGVQAFVGLASVLEGVGVSAYLGAAAFISTKAYLTAAASILSIESKHNAYLRAALKERPFPQPFDAPLDFNEVYTLASQFIVSCPASNPPFLPLVSFPTLTVKSSTPIIKSGSTITLTVNQKTKDDQYHHHKRNGGSSWCKNSCNKDLYAAWAALGKDVFVPAKFVGKNMYQVTVPDGIHGQSYVVLTTSATDDSDGSIVAGPAILEVSGTTGFPNLI